MATSQPRAKPSSPAAHKPRRQAGGSGITHVDLLFDPGEGSGTAFSRADLIFTGVDHSDISYEVRVFLNNRKADADTPRTPESGYAGRFVVFGHGQCFGDLGHCEVPDTAIRPLEPGGQHPVTPQTRIVTVTKALQRLRSTGASPLRTITLVPIAQMPNRADRGVKPNLFKYGSVSLQTYR